MRFCFNPTLKKFVFKLLHSFSETHISTNINCTNKVFTPRLIDISTVV